MARLPGYLKLVSIEKGDEPLTVEFTFRIRWWHPGWWLVVLREMWR